MKLKFGDNVLVTAKDFYHGAKGIVTYYDKIENRYEVQLLAGIVKTFYEEDLKKLRRKRGQ